MNVAWILAILGILVLSGCAEPSAPGMKDDNDLPPPRSNNPSNNIGYNAEMDVTGRVPDTPWSRECVRQWTSAAYTYYDPPVVNNAPCLFYPTANGTLFWQILDTDADVRYGLPAAPIEREDGFFDWFILDQHNYREPGGNVYFVQNGSAEPQYIWSDLSIDVHDGPRAMRLADNSVHLIAEKTAEVVPGLGQSREWLHLWADAEGSTQEETLPRGQGFHEPSLRGDGSTAVAIRGALDELQGAIYMTRGGAMQTVPVVGQVFDATADAAGVHACLAQGPAYVYGFYPFNESLQIWNYEVIHTSASAPLAFTCDIALVNDTVTVVTETPAAIGGGPNPTGGSQAWTRDGVQWTAASLPFTFHSGDDLGTYDNKALHVGATGSGTTNSNPQCGTAIHMPANGNPRNSWELVECNASGDWAYVLDTDGAPLIGASALLNPPYNYRASNFEGTGVQPTSVVLALPPDIEPSP